MVAAIIRECDQEIRKLPEGLLHLPLAGQPFSAKLMGFDIERFFIEDFVEQIGGELEVPIIQFFADCGLPVFRKVGEAGCRAEENAEDEEDGADQKRRRPAAVGRPGGDFVGNNRLHLWPGALRLHVVMTGRKFDEEIIECQ